MSLACIEIEPKRISQCHGVTNPSKPSVDQVFALEFLLSSTQFTHRQIFECHHYVNTLYATVYTSTGLHDVLRSHMYILIW